MGKYKVGDKFIIEIGEVIKGGAANEEDLYLFKDVNYFIDERTLRKLQIHSEDDLRVGDEVCSSLTGKNAIITKRTAYGYYILWGDGTSGEQSGQCIRDEFVRTGRHFALEDILKQLRYCSYVDWIEKELYK